MRAVCQRVSEARVTVDGAVTGEIGAGLVVLLGIERSDELGDAKEFARKVAQLRIFEDDRGKFAHSLLDTGGSALVVSQFTLVADRRKGNRPSFSNAAPAEQAAAEPEVLAQGAHLEQRLLRAADVGDRHEGFRLGHPSRSASRR